jgi:hypothetical protein
MSEPDAITNHELAALEHQLRATPLPVAGEVRDRLLYACGVEAGRAQARFATFRWTAAATVAGLLAGGLLTAASGHRSAPDAATRPASTARQVSVVNDTPSKARDRAIVATSTDKDRPASAPSASRAEPRKLTAGLRFDQALALMNAPAHAVEIGAELRGELQHPPLKPTSGSFH